MLTLLRYDIMIFLWITTIQKIRLWMLLFTLIHYNICLETCERYCSDLDDMSQVSFMCSSNTGGVLT